MANTGNRYSMTREQLMKQAYSIRDERLKKQQKARESSTYNIQKLKNEEDKQKQEANGQKNILEKAGDIRRGVGGFIKDAAVDIKDTAVGTYQGVGDIARGELATGELKRKTEERRVNSKEWSAYMRTLSEDDFNDPDVQRRLKEFSDKNKSIEVSQQSKEDLKKVQEIDSTKLAFQAAETFMNVATLGIGTPIKASGKALAKQTVKATSKYLTKEALKIAVKAGGKEAVEQIVKQGGEAAIKKAAQEALEEGVEIATKSAVRKVLGESAKDASIGAAYGITQTGKNATEDTKFNNYLIGLAFGAGIGAAIPVIGAGVGAGAKKIIKGVRGNKVAQVAKPGDKLSVAINDLVDYEGAPDKAKVKFYKDKIKKGEKIDELLVLKEPTGKLGVEDGKHRLAAYKELGYKKVPVKVGSQKNKDLNKMINAAIDEQSGKYGTTAWQRVKNWIGDQIDPYRAAVKVDDAYAKAKGIKRIKLNSEDSVEDLLRRSAASEREAAGLFEQKLKSGRSAFDLVKKYKGDSDIGKEFNNYTNMKFLKEVRAKKKNYKLPEGLDDESIARFIDDYEVRNPDALKDIALKKEINDMAVDYMVDSRVMTKAEGNVIKNSYKYAVPLEKVFPDDLARPQVTGRNVGSIAKQTVTQRLETGSSVPLSNSFDTMLKRVYKAVSQSNRAKVAQKLLERAEEGLVKGTKVAVVAGNKEARKSIREQAALVTKGVRYMQSKVKVSHRQMRKVQSELNKLNRAGKDISLKKGGKEGLPKFAVDGLSKLKTTKGKTVGSRRFFKEMIEADPRQLEVVRKKIAIREPKLAGKLDEVINYQQQMNSIRAARTDMKSVIADFIDDPTTGKQMISGVIDGQGFKMEVPPDLAKALMGLDQQKLPSVLKALAIAKKPFEVAWTGILNPVFSAISFALYDTPMSVINSAQGFKTFGPKAVIESLKSFKSSSAFQKALAREGARPYGGSGASSFIKPDAKSIASTRSLLSNIKYTSTHPQVALSKLDIWGGKLANSTRTRVARAAYDDALRIAKKEGRNIKDPVIQKRAMENAALAYRTIMPDFDTMSNLTRQINSVVPFYAASVAGTRSFGKALRRDPAATATKALALGVAPTVAITAYSLASPTGQAFYEEMERTKPYLLDNNMVVVLPGASKDDETGEWKGIIKVPLAPEFRAINQTIWRQTRALIGKGDGPTKAHTAWSLFDTATGGVRTSSNPLLDTIRILAGQDPRTGNRIIKGSMADLDKEDQVYDSTSTAAKWLAKRMGTSPIQADKIISQFGVAGQTVQNEGNPVEAIAGSVKNRVTGAYGESASRSFYNTYSPLKAKRDRVSREVTNLVKEGKRNEAKRKAEEFNNTLGGSFSKFAELYNNSDSYNPAWNDMLKGLFIRTGKNNFDARE